MRPGIVIAQVSNNGRNHWVVVTRKRGNDYDILDPGSNNDIKTTLSQYDNPIKIYAIRYYPPK